MDFMIVGGIIFGFLSLCLAHFLEGSALASLFNFPALIVVLGGSFSAIIVQTPRHIFNRSFELLPWLFHPPSIRYEFLIDKVFFWSKRKRQKGLLSIEHNLGNLRDPFLIKGADLLLAGVNKETLMDVMGAEIDTIESRDLNAAKLFESLGGYSPTFGILGAVLGLIQVMSSLSDPSKLGPGLAVAFVATIYGVGFANLVFLPIANRFKMYIFRRTRYYEMYLAGLLSLINNDSPAITKMKMECFVTGQL